ncbi:MAG: CDP-alcohol phosphatidyltransferase family protein [Maioricimonas sp. JB049]
MTTEEVKADCYSAGERDWMLATQRWREQALEPLLKSLVRVQVTPNGLTLLSLLVGLAFCPLWLVSRPAAMAALVMHVLLDGLDGPLARFTRVASRRGSFTDTMADQIVVTGVTITLMTTGTVGIVPGGAYVFLYTLVVAFAMIRNALAVPYSWLVRPRFIIYAWLLVETYAWPGSLGWLLWGFNALLTWKVLTGFRRIRAEL